MFSDFALNSGKKKFFFVSESFGKSWNNFFLFENLFFFFLRNFFGKLSGFFFYKIFFGFETNLG